MWSLQQRPRWIASVLTHTHALEYTHAHTLWDEQTHFPCCPLCSGFLGSRPIHHVPVCRGAAIHRLSSLLFFRIRPVSYSVSLPFSLLGSLYFAPPPPSTPSLSSSFYIFDSLPLSLPLSHPHSHSPRQENKGDLATYLVCFCLRACVMLRAQPTAPVSSTDTEITRTVFGLLWVTESDKAWTPTCYIAH